MKIKLFEDSGYLNMAAILHLPYNFIFIVGARGTGKTYGFLKTVIEENIKFMYMRRTQSEAEIIREEELSPFKPLNIDCGWNYQIKPMGKYAAGVYDCDLESKPKGLPVGMITALSTISNIRGLSAEDVEVFGYDEFIPEAHVRPIREEGKAWLNAYETINRNRELKGRKPLKAICMANSNNLANALFIELGLVRKVEKMKKNGQLISADKDRSIVIINAENSPISEKKKETALYKLSQDSEFSKMALQNVFATEEYSSTGSRQIIQYKPIVTVGEVTIYKHKSGNDYYASQYCSGNPIKYSSGPTDLKRFQRAYHWLWLEYMKNNITFEEHFVEILFTKYFE